MVEITIKMYTENQLHKIKKCYINLLNSDLDTNTLIDFFKLFDDSVCYIFEKSILNRYDSYDIFTYLNCVHSNYIVKYYDLNFKLLENISNVILYNLDICVNGSFGVDVYKKKDLKYYNYYIDLKTLNCNVFNFGCDVFISNDDICDLYTTIKTLTDIKIKSNIYFVNYKKSVYYNDDFKDVIKKVDKNIFNELTICNILNDSKLLINNRNEIMNYYSNMDSQCYLYKDINILYLNKDLNVCLCPSIHLDTKISIFDCIDNGALNESICYKIKELYDKYCMCCNYKQL